MIYSSLQCVVCIGIGANPRESHKNLYSWLDAVAHELNLRPIVFVYNLQEQRIPGLYHHMTSDEVQRFVGELITRLQDWEAYCIAIDKSCGVAMQADGRAGRMTVTQFLLGPFRDCQ